MKIWMNHLFTYSLVSPRLSEFSLMTWLMQVSQVSWVQFVCGRIRLANWWANFRTRLVLHFNDHLKATQIQNCFIYFIGISKISDGLAIPHPKYALRRKFEKPTYCVDQGLRRRTFSSLLRVKRRRLFRIDFTV